MPPRLRFSVSTSAFLAFAAAAMAALYHWPLFAFAVANLEVASVTGVLTLVTLAVAVCAASVLGFSLFALVSPRVLKGACMVAALGNSAAVYFVATYHVVLDKTMMGNVHNTNPAEAGELLHPALLAYVLVLGVLPCVALARVQIRPSPRLRVVALAVSTLVVTVAWAYLASSTWLWIDKNSKRLGGMVMPWSYVVNYFRYAVPALWPAAPAELLPPAKFTSAQPHVVVLIIGEAARAQDFSLYGYGRQTNPRLSSEGVVALANATSCSTYTTASVRCMLAPVEASSEFGKRYEPLPSYLQRMGVDVIWRSHNWGEPPLKVATYQRAQDLGAGCTTGCDFDEVLLNGLRERIAQAAGKNVFVVLHTGGSHGPAYSTKVPTAFQVFQPACASVELSQCSEQELLNAYDDTILYADHVVAEAIEMLKTLGDMPTALIYVSDHGESLGEHGLYLHGTPYSIAPDVQKRVPFIVWMSAAFERERGVDPARLAAQPAHTQQDIFHSVLGAFGMTSPVYAPAHDIFSPQFGQP